MSCTCKVGPGKFEGEPAIAFLAHEAVLNGWGDITTGGDEGDGPLTDWLNTFTQSDITAEMRQAARSYGYCEECIDAASAPHGLATWEDGQGFVGCEVFESDEAYTAKLKECEEADQEAQESTWEVIVGNIGTVYSGPDEDEARRRFRDYCHDAKADIGRAAGEQVTLMQDGEIVTEQDATLGEEDDAQAE